MSFRIVSGKSQMFERIRTENPQNILKTTQEILNFSGQITLGEKN